MSEATNTYFASEPTEFESLRTPTNFFFFYLLEIESFQFHLG